MISVIIPTHKAPAILDICLMSCIRGQRNINEIIVVVDGFYDLNKEVLYKWKDHINILNIGKNVGLSMATNLGVYNASHEMILIVNDDNVFPENWDTRLINDYVVGDVLSPNQIEPTLSMFKQFNIHNLGRSDKDFSIEKFWNYETHISKNLVETTGSTLPVFMQKYDYLRVGGWDVSYPGMQFVDWEFFMKLEMAGLRMTRTYNVHFYHFVSITDGIESDIVSDAKSEVEVRCLAYFKYKWGVIPSHNPTTNSKLVKI